MYQSEGSSSCDTGFLSTVSYPKNCKNGKLSNARPVLNWFRLALPGIMLEEHSHTQSSRIVTVLPSCLMCLSGSF